MAIPVIVLPFLAIAAAACPKPPPIKALVTASEESLSVATDFHLPELRKLAQQAGRAAAHPPYGFYLGSVAYTIVVDIDNEAHDVCLGPIDIRLTMQLTNRRIEVAQELKDDPCKFTKVVTHYHHHADADQAIFERYVRLVTATLSHTPATAFVADLAAASVGERIARTVQSIIEPVLASMDTDRISARKAVDTAAEVSRLESVCTKQL
ncbi:MAG: hypothetical protein M3Y22_06025 [Pseudomonadota bacterium]|nr:hypothetical protein [Pseudomonadota bacterium]